MREVQDIIDRQLVILFIGFNPGLRSAATGRHFAGHSNRFWKLLAHAGLTDGQLTAQEDEKLLEYGMGITNIVARPSRAAADITNEEYKEGRLILRHKLLEYRPQIACYAGIGVYKKFAGRPVVSCGAQPQSVVDGVVDFVAPSPSGLNRIPFAEQLGWYQTLHGLAFEELRARRNAARRQ